MQGYDERVTELMGTVDIRFKDLFEEIQRNKQVFDSLCNVRDTFHSTRWYTVLMDSFISQLEKLTFEDDPVFIGEYVMEFFYFMLEKDMFEA